jgi:hypothetical protein
VEEGGDDNLHGGVREAISRLSSPIPVLISCGQHTQRREPELDGITRHENLNDSDGM